MKIFGFDTEQAFDYENGFYLTSDSRRLQKLIAHYELYKIITHLPGAVLELGVFKGASFLRFASFRDMLETSTSREIIGFDAFGKFPTSGGQLNSDSVFIEKFEQVAGYGIDQEELQKSLNYKNTINTVLIAGDILETLPKYLEERPELRISLLHIDVDVYDPSRLALNLLYDRMVPNGIIVLDDYGTVAGETLAVDEFIHKKSLKLQKLPYSHIPTYIVKP